jgi:hypothetical protein
MAAKRLKDDSEWNIFEKQTNHDKRKTGMLRQEHKEYIINLYDQRPDARVVDVIESLTKSFENFQFKRNERSQLSSGMNAICLLKELLCTLKKEIPMINSNSDLNG